MSESAALSAFWSDELMVPEDTSEASSSCSRDSGENDCAAKVDEIDVISEPPKKLTVASAVHLAAQWARRINHILPASGEMFRSVSTLVLGNI